VHQGRGEHLCDEIAEIRRLGATGHEPEHHRGVTPIEHRERIRVPRRRHQQLTIGIAVQILHSTQLRNHTPEM
jgi:hypothetical protein